MRGWSVAARKSRARVMASSARRRMRAVFSSVARSISRRFSPRSRRLTSPTFASPLQTTTLLPPRAIDCKTHAERDDDVWRRRWSALLAAAGRALALARHLATFTARFAEADRDRLLAAGHTLAGSARLERTALALAH